MTYPSTRLTLSGEAESGRMAVRNGMDFTHRGGALRTKGKTQTWRYPDDPAVSLRHGPNGTPSGTPGRSNRGSTTGGLARRHFVGEMAQNREARGSRSRRNRAVSERR